MHVRLHNLAVGTDISSLALLAALDNGSLLGMCLIIEYTTWFTPDHKIVL